MASAGRGMLGPAGNCCQSFAPINWGECPHGVEMLRSVPSLVAPMVCGEGEVPMTETKKVLAANDAFYRAFGAGDYAAMDGLWSRQAPVACTHPGWTALTERARIMESWRSILSDVPGSSVSCFDAEAHVVGATAFVTCNEAVGHNMLAATNVFVREDGEWRMVHHHASPVARAYVKGGPTRDDRIY